ncbi:DUF3667 domain-containing protein [Nonlabens agnitus]|uniref:DUF3667 domain-containing protein n=1 Tax=Nonlabens agnitus TaxID=870484 RepID=A0A2S9WXG2_9FLAO|nr:DUF3667 domain-containing protein [Nonlabens agnitus]PRP68153.1 hypothetical protein BST86_14165 [Nonlabens agnitus]
MSLPVRLLPEYRSEKCLNCDTPLEKADKYCHQCGQINSKKRLSLFDFFSEFLSNFISYDNRIWRTISGILIRPGKVTQEYCAGRRTRYANPFRFFLTVSIVFFLLLQFSIKMAPETMAPIQISEDNNENTAEAGLFQLKIDSTVQNKQDLLRQMKEIQDSISKNGSPIQKFVTDKAIEEFEKDTTSLKLGRDSYTSQAELDSMSFIPRYINQIESYANFYDDHRNTTATEALEQLGHRKDNSNVFRYRKASKLQDVFSNPITLSDILLPKIPLFLFFFAPALSLIFWLLYARRNFTYMEHMVFNFHLFTFIFLSFYFMLAEFAFFESNILASIFFTLIGPFYLYKAMRNFYKQGRFKTILKFLMINFVFLILILASSSLFVIVSIFLSV